MDSEILSKTLAGSFTGAANGIYPQLRLIASVVFPRDVWIISVQFSTSLTIYAATPASIGTADCGGMLISFGKSPIDPISVSEELDSVIDHHTAPNSFAGSPPVYSPSSKVSVIPFKDCGRFLRKGELISLYAFAPAVTGNFLFAIASIQYRRAA